MENASSKDLSDEEMSTAIEEGTSIDCLEYFSVREIRDRVSGRCLVALKTYQPQQNLTRNAKQQDIDDIWHRWPQEIYRKSSI
jgi:hypothetical protein